MQAIDALKRRLLGGEPEDLTSHIGALCNGTLGEALRKFIETPEAQSLLPPSTRLSPASIVKDFLEKLDPHPKRDQELRLMSFGRR